MSYEKFSKYTIIPLSLIIVCLASCNDKKQQDSNDYVKLSEHKVTTFEFKDCKYIVLTYDDKYYKVLQVAPSGIVTTVAGGH